MAKNTKEKYKAANEQYLVEIAADPEMNKLPGGILCRKLVAGNGKQASRNSVVSVYYKGSLINGKVFDDNTSDNVPAAFRIRDLIPGWQVALENMREGDECMVVIPPAMGYGSRGVSGIPGDSALIFEIILVKVN